MQAVLMVVHILIVVLLVILVLLQQSEAGGAFGAGSSAGSFMTARGKADALSKMTMYVAALFFISALLMSILASWGRAPKSIMDATAPAGTSAPASTGGGTLLDQLKGPNPLAQPPGAPKPGQAAPSTQPAPAAPVHSNLLDQLKGANPLAAPGAAKTTQPAPATPSAPTTPAK